MVNEAHMINHMEYNRLKSHILRRDLKTIIDDNQFKQPNRALVFIWIKGIEINRMRLQSGSNKLQPPLVSEYDTVSQTSTYGGIRG